MAVTTQVTEHLSSRPRWECRSCRKPWPCAEAQARLLAEFEAFPSVLTIYLSAQMYAAMADLTEEGRPAPADLYGRFVSWSRPHF